MIRIIRLIVEYQGKDFVGWQFQKNGLSVQEVIEKALFRLTKEVISIRAAGRTDAGVHAYGQVVSFSTQSTLPISVFVQGLNAHLPRSVAILQADEMPENFDARFHAKGKWYRYQIWNSWTRSPLREQTYYHVRYPLQLSWMKEAATYLIGEHDFAAFRAADCERKSTIRTMYKVEVTEILFPFGREIYMDVEGTAFLKNMVRIMVGTLLEVGKQRMSLEQVQNRLHHADRSKIIPTAPAHGLILCRVDYEERAKQD